MHDSNLLLECIVCMCAVSNRSSDWMKWKKSGMPIKSRLLLTPYPSLQRGPTMHTLQLCSRFVYIRKCQYSSNRTSFFFCFSFLVNSGQGNLLQLAVNAARVRLHNTQLLFVKLYYIYIHTCVLILFRATLGEISSALEVVWGRHVASTQASFPT